jgi:hypothetical protein
LCNYVRQKDKYIPVLLQSSNAKYSGVARESKVSFINKNSNALSHELSNYLNNNLAFGDFIFRLPGTLEEIGRATNLKHMQKVIREMPMDCLKYHFNRNDLSRWLNARALFPIARTLRGLTLDDFNNVDEATNYLQKAILKYRFHIGKGVIARFEYDNYDTSINFARIGEGSLGGKARGLAFIDSFLKRFEVSEKFEMVDISIPRSVVLCTDIFDNFMELNNLYEIVLDKDISDEEILNNFITSLLPIDLNRDLEAILNVFKRPIAIRSSSLLEDSHYQPFAGIYSTYMIPNYPDNKELTLKNLKIAIKSVYASVFYKSSKSYMEATKNMIDEEKMAIHFL